MDYKKKYESALERARIWKDKSGMPKDKQGILDDIFPELKESEDERIRKELITHCRNIRCVTEEGAEVIAKWIAWLEKQGKHANFRNKIQIGDKVTRNRDGVLVNLSQLNRVAKKDEKQNEQKPADWSEEDEKMLVDLINYCDTGISYAQAECYKVEWKKRKDWLQSLKQRVKGE